MSCELPCSKQPRRKSKPAVSRCWLKSRCRENATALRSRTWGNPGNDSSPRGEQQAQVADSQTPSHRLGVFFCPSPGPPPLGSASSAPSTTVPDALSLVAGLPPSQPKGCSVGTSGSAHCFLLKTEHQKPKTPPAGQPVPRHTEQQKQRPHPPGGYIRRAVALHGPKPAADRHFADS